MDVTNFIGDFPTIEDLQNCKDIKAGDSAYVVKGGYLYVAVPTAAGIDLKQLRVGKGSRGLPGKVGPRGDVGPAGPQGIQGP